MLSINKLQIAALAFGLILAASETKAIDLALDIDFADYNDGVLIGESTVVTVTVSHLGPEEVDLSLVRFVGKYNFVTTEYLPNQYFSFTQIDPNCDLDLPPLDFDPRPPVDDYAIIYFGAINKTLQPFSSVSCEFIFTAVDQSIYDTLWELSLVVAISDSDLTNNSVQFTFGPQARQVPLGQSVVLILVMLIMTSLRILKIE